MYIWKGGTSVADEKKTYKFDFEIKPELCMDCATCWFVCTNDGGSNAVYVQANGTSQYAIDKDVCIRCARCFRACPVNAVWRINKQEAKSA